MVKIRRRGTAIVETENGILVVAGNKQVFMLPGGEAEKFETRSQAAMRELFEETNLRTNYAEPILNYIGKVHNGYNGKFQDDHTICLINFRGTPRPKNEISYIDYYNEKSSLNLSSSTKQIIENYFEWKKQNSSIIKKIKRLFFRKKIKFQKPEWIKCSLPNKYENYLLKNMPTQKIYFKDRKFKYKIIYKQDSDNHWSLYNYHCYKKLIVK